MRVATSTTTSRARHGRPADEHRARLARRLREDSTARPQQSVFASVDEAPARREQALRRFLTLTSRRRVD